MRRSLFVCTVVAMLLLTTAISLAGQFDWRKFEGTSIRVLLNRHIWQEAIEPLIPEFEALTGIKVVTEVYPEDQFRAKLAVEFAAGVANIDVTMMMPQQEGPQWMHEDWIVYLDKFIADPALTSPDYQPDDFLAAAWSAELTTFRDPAIKPQLIGVPICIENTALMYRKDIFAKYGLAVPKTMEELEEVCKVIKAKGEITPIVMRGRRAAATSQWSAFMHSFGANWLHPDGSPAINTPEAVAAFEFYGRLLRLYGPPGAVGYHWYETTTDFSGGKAAMHIGPNNFFPSIYLDPSRSQVVETAGIAPLPAGPAGSRPIVGVWGLTIPYLSRNQDAAWYFIQWATSLEVVRRLQMEDGIPGGRKSAWEDPEMPKYHQQELIDNVLESLETGSPLWNPPVIPIGEVRDIIGEVIVASIEGRDVQAAADAAARRMAQVLDR